MKVYTNEDLKTCAGNLSISLPAGEAIPDAPIDHETRSRIRRLAARYRALRMERELLQGDLSTARAAAERENGASRITPAHRRSGRVTTSARARLARMQARYERLDLEIRAAEEQARRMGVTTIGLSRGAL